MLTEHVAFVLIYRGGRQQVPKSHFYAADARTDDRAAFPVAVPGQLAAQAAYIVGRLSHQVTAEVLDGTGHGHFAPFQGAFAVACQAIVRIDEHEDPVAEPAVDDNGADVDDLHSCTCSAGPSGT